MSDGFREKAFGVFKNWWAHRASFLLSLAITGMALTIYGFTFIGEQPTPLFDFIARYELDSLDTRFRLRGRTKPDPRIIIVDIDQRSQEVLGKWPFDRKHFAEMLDHLREDGARVAAFDITFSKPDKMAEPLDTLLSQLDALKKAGKPLDPDILKLIKDDEHSYNYDDQLADSIRKFGKVVLGNYFLYTASDLQGVAKASLDRYAQLLQFYPFPQVRAINPQTGPADYVTMIQHYTDLRLLPRGAEANNETLTAALPSEKAACGFFNVVPDADGVIRKALMAIPFGTDPDTANWDIYASVDVQALRLYLSLPNEKTILNFGPAGIVSIEFGPDRIVRPDPVGRLMINYQGGARTYPYVSIADVVTKNFKPGTFKDKLVLVGASATGIGDLRATPFGGLDYPGVEIHANVIDNVLNQNYLVRGGKQVLTDILMILLFGIPLGIWLALTQPRWMSAGFLLLIPFGIFVYVMFLHGWWLNFIVPSLFTLVPNVSSVSIYRVLVEEREKRRVRGAFGQYVSPEVIRRLLTNPKMVEPRKTPITIMFSDIRGFTTISEGLDAQELAQLLNAYLTEMTRIVFNTRGTLDKYIGDAVMAIWGAPFEEPGHPDRAAEAALKMMARLGEMREKWEAEKMPRIDIGIGLNTGTASVGNMGSALRYGYTAMGDSVNLASRLEGLNKEYTTHIILSESTYVGMADTSYLVRELDLIRVKGKLLPVTIYELMGRKESAGELLELAEMFTEAHEAYKRRDWSETLRVLSKVLDRWPKDGPTRVFYARAEEYITEEPPADWDGVYVMKHK
ncbi:MAG: CHASE2 domain-containing protein [Candidatus Acidiferrales bacterium]